MSRKPISPEVYKFGGASLGDAAAFLNAAAIVKRCAGPVAVVCSAPSGLTDLLLEVADKARHGDTAKMNAAVKTLREKYSTIVGGLELKAKLRDEVTEQIEASLHELELLASGLVVLRELTPRTSDLVVSRGERLSAPMFAAVLRNQGVASQVVDALEVVATDGPFGGAAPKLEQTDALARRKLRPLLAAGVVPVVPGFLGAFHEDGAAVPAVVTLGRGGSDMTATLLGRALAASRVCLWKDVPKGEPFQRQRQGVTI